MQIPRLREWRERRALTQVELAERAGVSERSVAGYEAGGGARLPTVRRLAEALGIEVTDLYGDSEHPLGEAPASPEQPSFNGLLEEEQSEAIYRPWFEYVNRYADRWEKRIEAGDFDMSNVNELMATLDDLGPTLSKLGLQEKREQPPGYIYSFGPSMGEAIARLMDLLNFLMEASVGQFGNAEIKQLRPRIEETRRTLEQAA